MGIRMQKLEEVLLAEGVFEYDYTFAEIHTEHETAKSLHRKHWQNRERRCKNRDRHAEKMWDRNWRTYTTGKSNAEFRAESRERIYRADAEAEFMAEFEDDSANVEYLDWDLQDAREVLAEEERTLENLDELRRHIEALREYIAEREFELGLRSANCDHLRSILERYSA